MLWLYDIKRHFILICDPHAWTKPMIKTLSPSLLATVRAGMKAVTSQPEITNPNLSMIFYIFFNNSR